LGAGAMMMAPKDTQKDFKIRLLAHPDEVDACARCMAGSEPWITLGRGHDESVKLLTDQSKEVYVAVLDGKISGFIVLVMNGAFVGYIQTICVFPECRGSGIGSRLIEFAEKRIFAVTPNVFMCVSSFNTKAQDLYRRLGYQVVGELKDYVVDGHSEILLRKTIGPLDGFKKMS
jgi:[ribosomal protein S18]-alanine N-acetyltransferase